MVSCWTCYSLDPRFRTTANSLAIRGTAHPNPETGLLSLRSALMAYANIRPLRLYSQSLIPLSPLKPSIIANADFTIVRENCGGAYFGKKTEPPADIANAGPSAFASDSWSYTTVEIERVGRVAAALALQHTPPLKVISSDKANVLASGRLWRKVMTALFAREFPQIELRHQLADSLAMTMITAPQSLNGVIVTDNTFGDMLSDEAGGLVGTLGTLPSASLCGVPAAGSTKGVNGIYEPVHGSAPDISGKGIVNPVGQILSLALMLRYSFGMSHEAELVESAVRKVLDGKDIGGLEIRTRDLGGSAGTAEVGDAVCGVLTGLLTGPDDIEFRIDGDGLDNTTGGLLQVPVLPGHQKRLSALFRETRHERPRTAHKDENLEWEKKLEGLPRHESLAL
jgi:3-isopropylmalate dehydrogenase